MAEWPDWNPPGNDRAPALSAALHGRRRDEPARRARSLSRQDGVSHPRHQSALDHRHLRVFGMHPAKQRRRHGSLYPGQGRHARGGAAGQATGDGGRTAACIGRWSIGVTQRWVGNNCAADTAVRLARSAMSFLLEIVAPEVTVTFERSWPVAAGTRALDHN